VCKKLLNSGIGFSIPANFNKEFLDGIEKILNAVDTFNYIDNIYGSPRSLILGQSRASKKIPELSNNELSNYIKVVHKLKIKFNLTVNSIWSNGIERKKENLKRIFKYIENFLKLGVDSFIIGNLYLAELIKLEFQEINLIASINLKTDSVYKLKSLLEDFNFNKVVMERTTNRDINFLKSINKKYDNNIILLANPDCLFDCALSSYHMLENGHLSMIGDVFMKKNYCINYCKHKFKDIDNIIKTSWIHPCDLDLYQNIGIKYLKIQGRTLSTKRILNLTKAYLSGKTIKSNLLEIYPNFLGKDNYIKENDYIYNNFNRREFIESFFKKNINCKVSCGISCKKCDIISSKLLKEKNV